MQEMEAQVVDANRRTAAAEDRVCIAIVAQGFFCSWIDLDCLTPVQCCCHTVQLVQLCVVDLSCFCVHWTVTDFSSCFRFVLFVVAKYVMHIHLWYIEIEILNKFLFFVYIWYYCRFCSLCES